MTRSTPDYDDAELVVRSVRAKRKPNMQLDAKSIISACAVILREQRDEHRKATAELTARIEALEQRAPPRSLRAIGGE